MNVVYDDIVYSLQKHGGISVYWSEITRNTDQALRVVYDSAVNNRVYEKKLMNKSLVKSGRLLQIKRFLPLKIKEYLREPFIFHSSYYRYCCNKNALNVTTIHDFTNELYAKGILAYIRYIRKKVTIAHSKAVICISNNTFDDFKRFFPNYRGLVKVIYNGYDSQSYYLIPEIHKEKIILFVGERRLYKRFDLAVKIAKNFKDCRFVIVGGGDLSDEEFNLLEQNLKNRYEKHGFVDNNKLRELYNKAFFLCYPSEYEGFGIPIIEAQACGCPVVCQKKSCIPEIGNNAAVYFTENEIDNSDGDIYKLNNSDYYREKVELGLTNVKRFSWENCRKKVHDLYNNVMNSVKCKP